MSDEKKVVKLITKGENSCMWTVKDMLEACIKDHTLPSGGSRVPAKKALVILLNTDDGDYTIGYRNAGLSMSECIALTRIAETLFMEEMGFINNR